MLSDLDILMRARAIDTLLVPMHEVLHPAFRWITRGAKVTKGYAVKRAGEAPLLVSYPMERDEAAATGLATRLVHDFDYDRIFKSAPNPVAAYGELFDRVLREVGAGPSVAFAGNLPIHLYLGIADELQRRGWNVVRSTGDDIVQLARKRKEPWEIDAIASVGARTEQVVDRVREVLRASVVDDGRVLHRGEVLTLGFLKQLVSAEIARLGMVEDHDTILSQGRDAAVPHSRGDAAAAVRPSVPIVLDIFPLDRESGYFFDTTRTFCVGPVPEELAKVRPALLEGVGPLALRKIAESAFVVQLKPGDLVVRRGTADREMYLVLKGELDVEGRVRIHEGETMGEMAFLGTPGVRTATVHAVSPARLLVLRRRFLDELAATDLRAAYSVARNLARVAADRFTERISRE